MIQQIQNNDALYYNIIYLPAHIAHPTLQHPTLQHHTLQHHVLQAQITSLLGDALF